MYTFCVSKCKNSVLILLYQKIKNSLFNLITNHLKMLGDYARKTIRRMLF